MRTIVTICLWLVLAGCSDMPVAPGSLYDRLGIGSTEKYKARIEPRKADDDAKCRDFQFKPGTEAFGNCRLSLEQIRATERATDTTERANRASRNRQAAPSTLDFARFGRFTGLRIRQIRTAFLLAALSLDFHV